MSSFIIKTKYNILKYTVYEGIKFRRFLNKLKIIDFIGASIFFRYNKTNIIFIKNAKNQAKINYIDMQYYYI